MTSIGISFLKASLPKCVVPSLEVFLKLCKAGGRPGFVSSSYAGLSSLNRVQGFVELPNCTR